jgi:hypothetical protein
MALVLGVLLWGSGRAARKFRATHRPASGRISISAAFGQAGQAAKSPVPKATLTATPGPAPAAVAPAAPAETMLRAVRHVSNSDSTVVELELDRPVEFHAQALHGPERLFLDLLASGIAPEVGSSQAIIKFDVSDPRVQRIRVGHHEDVTRVVLDLNCECAYSYRMSQQPPYRLAVTVGGTIASPRSETSARGGDKTP